MIHRFSVVMVLGILVVASLSQAGQTTRRRPGQQRAQVSAQNSGECAEALRLYRRTSGPNGGTYAQWLRQNGYTHCRPAYIDTPAGRADLERRRRAYRAEEAARSARIRASEERERRDGPVQLVEERRPSPPLEADTMVWYDYCAYASGPTAREACLRPKMEYNQQMIRQGKPTSSDNASK